MSAIIKTGLDQLAELVEKYAKYQKVMLIYDQNVSNFDLSNVTNKIKEFTIYNAKEIGDKNTKEIFDGYKMLIFLCSADSFLKFDYPIDEFVNLFISQDENILPFCLDNHNHIAEKTILLANTTRVDKSACSSLFFANFYNYFARLYTQQEQENEIEIAEISQRGVITCLNKIMPDIEFVDIDILKKTGINYSDLPMVDYLLLAGFEAFVVGAKQRNLAMTDLYKNISDDQNLIEKFFALSQNDAIFLLIDYNFSNLQQRIISAMSNVKNFVQTFDRTKTAQMVLKIKEYCKNCSGILNYLYLYDVFKI